MDEQLTNFESEDDDMSTASAAEPGALLSLLKDNTEEDLSYSEVRNCTVGDGDIEENKENELQSCKKSFCSQFVSVQKLDKSKHKQEETSSQESDSLQRILASSEKLQKQGVLTSHSLNVSDPRTDASTAQIRETSLGDLFGYKRSVKIRKRDNHKSVPVREKADVDPGIPVQPIEVIDIDSGYLSDTEMSTDGDTPTPTPTPTPSAAAHNTPLSSGGNLPLSQGSAVGTKVCCFCFCYCCCCFVIKNEINFIVFNALEK